MARADVTVVGAGVIGLAVAWRLCQTGRTITVIDPAPGRGASYVAAGMLAPVTEAAYGEEPLLRLNLASARRWPEFAADLEADAGLSIGLERAGTLLVGRDASDRAELEELAAFQRQHGLHATWHRPSDARELEPLLSPEITGALFARDDHQVDNRRLLAALATALVQRGARLVTERVEALSLSGGRVGGVMVNGEEISSPTVVLAAGHDSATLAGLPAGSAPAVRPVKGQILRLFAPDAELRLRRTVRARVAGHSVYVVPRRDGRVVIGATVEERGADRTVTAGAVYELLRDATRVLPVVHEYELAEASVGLRPGSHDNAPIIGEAAVPGLVLATGHYRNGVLLAPITADAVVAVLDGADVAEVARRFAPRDARPPAGGPARGLAPALGG